MNKMKKFKEYMILWFNDFWYSLDLGWWKYYRVFVMALSLLYLTEFLFLEQGKLLYLTVFIVHGFANYVFLPWLYMRVDRK